MREEGGGGEMGHERGRKGGGGGEEMGDVGGGGRVGKNGFMRNGLIKKVISTIGYIKTTTKTTK